MKKFLTSIYLLALTVVADGQSESIRFTARQNPLQYNELQVFAKNVTTTPIAGVLGASNLTLCIAFPAMYTGAAIISTPISGQTFDLIYQIKEKIGSDSVYAWNGLGSTGEVTFAPGLEVHIATMIFPGNFPDMTSVKLYNAANGGASGFAYNYIAPNGFEHCSYANPFYSNIPNDPLLVNANGPNDAFSQGNSYISFAHIVLPVKFTSFFVSKKDDNAQLTWSVENEDNNTLFYDLQTSTNGRNFTSFSRINATRNRSSNTYKTTDYTISRYTSAQVYYRIVQTEANGRLVYSDIQKVSVDRKLYTIGLYPNNVQSTTRLVVEAVKAGKTVVNIYDALGKLLQRFDWQLATGNNQKEINVSMLPAGTYLLTVTTEKGSETLRFVKR